MRMMPAALGCYKRLGPARLGDGECRGVVLLHDDTGDHTLFDGVPQVFHRRQEEPMERHRRHHLMLPCRGTSSPFPSSLHTRQGRPPAGNSPSAGYPSSLASTNKDGSQRRQAYSLAFLVELTRRGRSGRILSHMEKCGGWRVFSMWPRSRPSLTW